MKKKKKDTITQGHLQPPPPLLFPLEWSLDVSSQNKIYKIFLGELFSHGSDVLNLKFPKISPEQQESFAFVSLFKKKPTTPRTYILLS